MRGGVCGRPLVVEAMKGEPMSAPENVRTVGGAAEFGVIDPVFVPTALVEVAEDAAARLDLSETGARTVHFSGKVSKSPKTAAIILAGGSGERFGHEGGKQLVEISGRPMLTWSIAAFDAVEDVGEIVVVCPEERIAEYRSCAIDPYPFVTPITMAPAGATRQESAFSGLEYASEEYEYVVLHDGARPLIAPELIAHTINTLKGTLDADGAIVATPSIDTLKVVENGCIVGTPDRRVFWNAQTPQVFRAVVYRRAHASALSEGFVGTDDSSLIERLGGKVLVVEGKRSNIKLTVPEDYAMLNMSLGVQPD